jgi:opacity protein-like surface antigen
MKLRLLTAALSIVTATLVPAAHAQYYGGVVLSGTGLVLSKAPARSEFGFNGGEKPSELVDLYQLSRGLTLSTEPSVGMKLGYRFTPYFSVEGRYADRAASTTRALFQRDGLAAREKSMGLDLVGSLPVFKALLLEGRAGFRTENLNGVDTVGVSTLGQRSLGTGALGVGVQYNFNSSLGLRFEVERSRKFFSDRGNNDAENVMFGIHWRF